MKNLKRNSISIAALVAGLWLGSCDTLTKDTPVDGNGVDVVSNSVYVAQSGISYINLNSLIKTTTPVKIVLDEMPRYGSLGESKYGKGLFEYSPQLISSKGDGFSFSVLTEDGKLIKQQKVNVLSAARSQDLSCNAILAFTDNFTNLGTSGIVTIDLLANDWICNDLKSDLELTIIDGPVYGGQIQITPDNKLLYTIPSGSNSKSFDKFAYQVKSKSNPAIQSIAVAYLNFGSDCFFSPGAGYYTVSLAEVSSLKFSPLSQAILCGDQIADVAIHIVSQPKFGTVTIDSQNQFSYSPTDLNKETYTDLMVYEVCLRNGSCKKSTVGFKLTSAIACNQKAIDDVVGVWGTVNPTVGYYFDIQKNDCSMEQIASMRLVSNPGFGQASIDNLNPTLIKYFVNNPAEYHNDELTYEVCFNGGSCSQAKVYILRY